MKKAIFLIIITFMLAGCTSEIKLKGDITEIKYNDITILDSDYDQIKALLNTKFSNEKHNAQNDLTIKTTEDIYYVKVSDKYVGYNGKYAANDKLGIYLKKLKDKYQNTDFYDISYEKDYTDSEDDLNINLDKTSNYIIIKLNGEIKNFKINEIEFEDDTYKDIDLLYEKENIKNKTIAIRKSVNIHKPDIRISFTNLYNYKVSLIPVYKNDKIIFEARYKLKEDN